ncbi:TetR/AcrR family transcriptional regulator [Tautonia rosea]|uniref:TetR/AcrR family transcriptional regulator n=1 Tax=Tautonia rosea TaxID=2728037 RepID=UPI0019D19EE0|nr:TetR/AcrR family transcriptional regulator [Tautonia rosea]
MSEGVSPPAPARLTDRKRAAILDAAVEEFATSGFDTTSMDRIAERAGVSKRTVYNHFQSKDVLFEAIVQELIAQTEALPEFPYDPDRDLAEQLVSYCAKVAELITSESFQGLVRVSLSRFLRTPQLARDTIGDEKRFMARLIRWIEQATADGRLKPVPAEFAAHQLCALIEGFVLWPPIFGLGPNPEPEDRQQIIRSAVAMFLDHYRS